MEMCFRFFFIPFGILLANISLHRTSQDGSLIGKKERGVEWGSR